jgi:hypothetical protein
MELELESRYSPDSSHKTLLINRNFDGKRENSAFCFALPALSIANIGPRLSSHFEVNFGSGAREQIFT